MTRERKEVDDWLETYEALEREVELFFHLLDNFFPQREPFYDRAGKGIVEPAEGVSRIIINDDTLIIEGKDGDLRIDTDRMDDVYRNARALLDLHEKMINRVKERIAEHEAKFKAVKDKLMPVLVARSLKG